ncbi:MAG: translocation/assembly module TamB domain-containing protein [Bacteroidaceae bacterium]|nr:translocation/assembly module TamB domain-containing protein [Bacteroidaceae bacterium]
MKRGKTLHIAVLLSAALYLGCNVLIHSDRVSYTAARYVSSQARKILGSDISVGNIQLIRPMGLNMENVILMTPDGDTLATMSSATARMKLLPVLGGHLEISGIRLLNPDIRLRRDSVTGQANYQFLLDMLPSGKDGKTGTLPYISANSVILKNGRVTYDVIGEPDKPGVLDRNHLDIYNVNANISLKALSADTLNLHVRNLGFEEKSGLGLRHLESKVIIGNRLTQLAGFRLNMDGSHVSIDELTIEGTLHNIADGSYNVIMPHFDSRISPADFAPFIPEFAGFKDNMILTLSLSGRTDSVHIDNLRIRTSGNVMSAGMKGAILNAADSLELRAVDMQLSTNAGFYDWTNRNLSGFGWQLPGLVESIENTDISLAANGNIGNNDVRVFVKSDNAGILNASLITENGVHRVELTSKSINIGTFTGITEIGMASVDFTATHSQSDSVTHIGDAKLSLPFLEYKGYRYTNIDAGLSLDGNRYSLSLNIADDNATVEADIAYDMQNASSAVSVNVDNYDLAATHILASDSIAGISGMLTADIQGSGIDMMRGSIIIDSLRYIRPDDTINLGRTMLSVNDMSDGGIMSSLNFGDVVNATLYGKYRLSTIAGSFKRTANTFSPELYSYINSGKRDRATLYDNDFDIYLSVRKNDLLQRILDIPLSINDMVTLHSGITDVSNEKELTIDVPSISYDGNLISEFNLHLSGGEDTVSVSMTGRYQPDRGKSKTVYGFVSGSDNMLNTLFSWNDTGTGVSEGNVLADVLIGPYNRRTDKLRIKVGLSDADFIINGRSWHAGNTSIVSDSGMYSIDHLVISNERQSVSVAGIISADTSHTVSVVMDNICLDEIAALLDRKSGEPLISGNASGAIKASSVLGKPIIYGHIGTGAMSLMGTEIDSLRAVADWNRDRQAVDIKLDILSDDTCHTTAQGVFVPQNDSLDINIRANRLNMYFLNRVIPKNTINEIKTYLTANLRIFGNLKRIDFLGDAYIEDTYVDVTPNNVMYYVPGTVMNIRPGLFAFRDMDTYDMYGNYGIVDLNIMHSHLKHFRVNLDLQSNGIEVFDIPDKEYSQIHGRIFAGGTPSLSTQPELVSITGNCVTAPGTWLDIKSGVSNAANYSFLTIKDASVSLEDFYDIRERETAAKKIRKKASALDINLNAELTDNAVVYAQLDNITGSIRGTGNVAFRYDTHNGVNMSGIYNITRGDCVLSLQQILRKEFTILGDSRVTFNGGLENTNLAIHASHTVNSVSMYDLDVKANSSSRVRARCLMDVTGTVSSPQLAFDVDAPQASMEERELIASATSTEEQRNMQFMYLLTLGRFYTYDYSNASSLSANPVSAMQSLLNSTINGQINNLLSYVLNSDFVSLSSNLSTGYLSGDPTSFTDDTFEGILEAHLLNNRLILNGNFGYRKNNLNQTSSVIGDFELKWLLFPRAGISLLGYNRNNQRYYTKTTLNTQGFGVAYENDFDSFCGKDRQKSEAVEDRKKRKRHRQ